MHNNMKCGYGAVPLSFSHSWSTKVSLKLNGWSEWCDLICLLYIDNKLSGICIWHSCSSADEGEDFDMDPHAKAAREKERRQANNARER